MKRSIVFLLGLVFLTFSLSGQETFDYTIPQKERGSLAPENPETLPRQFRELSLGMGLIELKQALLADDLFTFRGDRDVSFLPVREQTLVETTGFSFIRRAFFQLEEEKVYIMAFTLNTRLLDHYSVYTSLVKKYGEPLSLNPREAIWESEDTRLSIERPLTLKYLDKTVFNDIIEGSKAQESRELLLREEFLREL